MNRRTAIAIFVASTIIGVLFFTGTRGGLEYFSPSTLELTTQSEFALVGGAFPIYRSSLDPVDNELIAFIRDEKFVAPEQTTNQQLVCVFHWNSAWRDGYGLLYDLFHRRRDDVIEWCKEDRERAQLYWDEGFRYLRSKNPTEVQIGQAILNFGWRAKSIEELKAQIASIKREFDM